MRVRTGHKPDDWTENTPGANPGTQKLGGSLVVGEPGANAPARKAEYTRRYKAKLAQETAE